MSGGVHPIRDRPLGDIPGRCHIEAGEVMASAIQPAVLDEQEHTIVHNLSRDELKPCRSAEKREKAPKRKGMDR